MDKTGDFFVPPARFLNRGHSGTSKRFRTTDLQTLHDYCTCRRLLGWLTVNKYVNVYFIKNILLSHTVPQDSFIVKIIYCTVQERQFGKNEHAAEIIRTISIITGLERLSL